VPDRLAGYLCLYRAYDMRFLIRLLALFALFALLALLAFCQAHFCLFFEPCPTASNVAASVAASSGDNPIAAKPVRAMGLPAFLAAVFMPRHCFALCHPAIAVWAGGLLENRRIIFWDFNRKYHH
jgi:hypothetical protein